jgi:hypothetical protein
MSFRKKPKTIKSYLMHTNILFIFIPVVIVFGLLVHSIFVNSRVDVYTQKLSMVEQYGANLKGVENDILYMANSICFDEDVRRILSAKQFADEYETVSSAQTVLDTMTQITNAVYAKNYTMNILGFGGFSYYQNPEYGYSISLDVEHLESEGWFREVEEKNGAICYFSRHCSTALAKAFPDAAAFAGRMARWARRLGNRFAEIEGTECRACKVVENPKTLTEYDENHPYIVALYDKEEKG